MSSYAQAALTAYHLFDQYVLGHHQTDLDYIVAIIEKSNLEIKNQIDADFVADVT